MNFRPEMGDEYYIDNVEWFAISDDDCLSQTTPITIFVEDCSYKNELTKESIAIFPNPTSGQINVKSIDEIIEVSISDLTGKIITTLSPSKQGVLQLDLSNMSNGHYHVRVETKNSVVFKPILLSR